MQLRQSINALLLLIIFCLQVSPASAYREYFTPEQKTKLEGIQTILVEALALTDKGAVDATSILEVAFRRFSELGYAVVLDPAKPHDVTFRVKCEQRKTWEGTTAGGGDADLPDAPVRLWKGPACQLTYVLDGLKIHWQKEVRTEFQDAVAAAQSAQTADPGLYALGKLRDTLGRFEFPLLVAAEWGHAERLLALLDSADTTQSRKMTIISLLGEMQADDALPKLREALENRDLAQEALMAMGNLGSESVPILVEIMTQSLQVEVQAAAAKGLGRIGGTAGDASVVPPPCWRNCKIPKRTGSSSRKSPGRLGKSLTSDQFSHFTISTRSCRRSAIPTICSSRSSRKLSSGRSNSAIRGISTVGAGHPTTKQGWRASLNHSARPSLIVSQVFAAMRLLPRQTPSVFVRVQHDGGTPFIIR